MLEIANREGKDASVSQALLRGVTSMGRCWGDRKTPRCRTNATHPVRAAELESVSLVGEGPVGR